MGGSGKTPVVIALARALLSRGLRVTVISRGYRRRTSDILEVFSDMHWLDCGDEPLLIKRSCDARVIVAKNRFEATKLYAHNTDIFLLDDGFQHFALHKDATVLVLSGTEFSTGIFPFGNRRDGLWRFENPHENLHFLAPASAHTAKYPENISKNTTHFTIESTGFRSLSNREEKLPLDFVHGKKVFAAAGIARPERFLNTLEKLGAQIVGKKFYLDHFFYGRERASFVRKKALLTNADLIVVTAKDATKLPPARDFYSLEIQCTIDNAENFVDNLLHSIK